MYPAEKTWVTTWGLQIEYKIPLKNCEYEKGKIVRKKADCERKTGCNEHPTSYKDNIYLATTGEAAKYEPKELFDCSNVAQ